ncbi:MAG: hypothetical protein K0R27_3424 [Xanthobacteraceae bacterium]|jgi:choline dehydrogenase|nr:hypothetical protein [Xanthobacteraceae bacterium]
MTSHDYIVIGAGSSGSVVAARLSEDPRTSVLLIEAGGSDRSLNIQMPAASYLKAIANARFDWRFKADADPTRHGRRDYMPRGKVLGGSSSINGMVYLRGQPEDFDAWEALGNRGWGFADVLPYFRKAENNENGADDLHGAGGPLFVSNLRVTHPVSDAFVRAGVKAGLPLKSDLNRPPQEGVGFIQATQVRGRRCSAARAYLWPAMGRRNLRILSNAHVRRVLFDGTRASGVEYERSGQRESAVAGKAVIVCAGALASPQILMLSGVGSGAHLREMGVEVVCDLPGVGANFHDHPGTCHIAWVNTPTYNVQTGLPRILWFGARWLLTGRGPASTPDTHALGFIKSRPDLERCDIEYHFTPVGYDLTEDGPILFDKPAVTALANVHRPHSRGVVRLKSADHREQPLIQPNLFDDERDLDTLVIGAKFLRTLFETDPLSRFVTSEFKPGPDVCTDEDWRSYVRESGIGFYHPAGTCKMGRDPQAVVDERLKVHGVEGLYVADASIMPQIVSANLNANCIMIGERCADFVKSAG